MQQDYNKLRDKFHDLKSRSTSFNTGISLLKERLTSGANYPEIITLMDDALVNVNQLWEKLKKDISI